MDASSDVCPPSLRLIGLDREGFEDEMAAEWHRGISVQLAHVLHHTCCYFWLPQHKGGRHDPSLAEAGDRPWCGLCHLQHECRSSLLVRSFSSLEADFCWSRVGRNFIFVNKLISACFVVVSFWVRTLSCSFECYPR